MKKKVKVRFDYLDGTEEILELVTSDVEKAIFEQSQNKPLLHYEILEVIEDQPVKKLLLD